MWDAIETLIYITLLLLFLSTFVPRKRRRQAIFALGVIWRLIEPTAYRLVTGRPMPAAAAATVNHSEVTAPPQPARQAADKTDRQTDRPSVSEGDRRRPRWELDRTRAALMEELLYSGWTIADFRRERIFRGDNGEIGAEVEQARKRLGLDSSQGRTPIAGRVTAAQFPDR